MLVLLSILLLNSGRFNTEILFLYSIIRSLYCNVVDFPTFSSPPHLPSHITPYPSHITPSQFWHHPLSPHPLSQLSHLTPSHLTPLTSPLSHHSLSLLINFPPHLLLPHFLSSHNFLTSLSSLLPRARTHCCSWSKHSCAASSVSKKAE